MKFLTHEGLQYFYNQIAAKFSTKEQTAEAIEEAVGNAGVGTVTSVNGKTGVVQLSASDVGAATEIYVDNKVASMVDSAPETLNTLNELAAALGDDPNFATTVANQIGGKADADHIQALAKGGTGATERKSAFSNLAFIGNNPITSTENDTPPKWTELGPGYARFSQNYVTDQPYTYGILINYTYYQDVAQIWLSLSSSKKMYTRAGNADGWFTSWTAVYDTVNKPTAADVGAISKAGDTMTGRLKLTSSDGYPTLAFHAVGSDSYAAAIQTTTSTGRLSFTEKASDTGYLEVFQLPTPSEKLTETKYHNIITSKGGTINGSLIINANSLFVRNNVPMVNLQNADGSETMGALSGVANGSGSNYTVRLAARGKGTSFYEYYSTPYAANNLTANKYYDLLTTRSAVTVAQGGTGATTADAACNNIGAVKKSGDTMTGPLTATQLNASIENSYNIMTADRNGKTTFLLQQDVASSRVQLMQIHPNSTFAERYRLPYANAEATADTNYDILTTKNTITIAQGGTGATDAATARTNLGALPGQTISYTLSTAGWYRIASSKVGIDNTIGDFTICGGGSGTHTIVSFKAAIAIGKNPQILQLLNTTYNGVNQYTKARIVYHTTYSGNYAYLEVYKNGTASSSTKFMYYGEGWTLQKPVAGSIPSGYTSKEFTFVPQTSIASAENITSAENINVISNTTGKDFDVGVQNPNGHIALQVSTNRGIWDYDKAAWVLRALKGSTAWHLDGTAAALQDVNISTATLSISMNQTPIIWARNNGKTSWSLERNGATQNTMAAHYYDEDGNWTTSGFLLDHSNFTTYVTPAAIGALPISGGTLTGVLTLKGAQYGADATTGGLNCNNSTITQVNAIYFADTINSLDAAGEGINFVHGSGGTYDTLYAISGNLKFVPNRALGSNGTAYTVYHTGNKPSASDVGAAPASHEHSAAHITSGTLSIARGGTGAVNEVTAANNLKVQSLGYGVDIPANANLNNYTTVGNYRCTSTSTGATIANCPVADAFTLQVYASTGTSTSAPTTAGWAYFLQKLTTIEGAQYYRSIKFLNSATGTFGDWVKVYDSGNNKPTAADVGAVALNGNSTVNGTITATKIIGAVYA